LEERPLQATGYDTGGAGASTGFDWRIARVLDKAERLAKLAAVGLIGGI
jgi:hypothetical protein